MTRDEFFPARPETQPIIYAYCEPNNPQLKGMLKVGYTSRTIDQRMHEHYPTLKPGEVLNDKELAEQMGMSRTPVREAILMLSMANLVVVRIIARGRGTIVQTEDVPA